MEGGQFTPVSILKKPRVTEAVNTSVRKVVLIADKDVNEDNEEAISNVSEPYSEDSAMCVKEGDSDNLQSMDVTVTPTPGSVADRERRKWEGGGWEGWGEGGWSHCPWSHCPISFYSIIV